MDCFVRWMKKVRCDKLTQIWDRFGTLILAGCIGIVVLVGSYKGWQYWQAQLAEKAGMKWYNAITLSDAGKTAEADAAFDEITKSGHKGYSVLARRLRQPESVRMARPQTL